MQGKNKGQSRELSFHVYNYCAQCSIRPLLRYQIHVESQSTAIPATPTGEKNLAQLYVVIM